MNFDHVVGTIVSKGFTERQARFLWPSRAVNSTSKASPSWYT